MFNRILAGYNGSEGAKEALATALTLAKTSSSHICALAVEGEVPRYAARSAPDTEIEQRRADYFGPITEEARRAAQKKGLELEAAVVPGIPEEEIVKHARTGNYGLIVLGHRGHSRLHEYLLGATTDRVARTAACSVVIVPEPHGSLRAS